MALPALRRAENAPGDLWVDSSCIDCDTCRWMAPSTFARRGSQSAVVRQPEDRAQRDAALLALVACPTASIGCTSGAGVAEAAHAFPVPVAGSVFHCGYHSKDSFGATSYLIRRTGRDGRPQNILIDSPRFAAPLAARIEQLGGVGAMLFTHRDDVADHAKWADRFGCRRIIHARDAPPVGSSSGKAFDLFRGDEAVEVAPGLLGIPTPGHTAGSMCFLWNDPNGQVMLFTGDHLAYDPARDALEAWPDVCWHDWGQQTESMRALAEYGFDSVLPGHGRRVQFPQAVMQAKMHELVEWMESVDG